MFEFYLQDLIKQVCYFFVLGDAVSILRNLPATHLEGGRSGGAYRIQLGDHDLIFKFADPIDPDIYQELLNEVKIYRYLGKTDFSPELQFYGKMMDSLYSIAYKYIPGKAFRSFRHMSEKQRELCKKALDQLHKRGVLHGDVRPDNFVIDGEERAVIIDFGFSVLIENPKERSKNEFHSEIRAIDELDD